MKQFSELGISVASKHFEGDKIPPESVLNRPIKVLGFKIEPSKFKERGNGMRLQMQIEVNNEKRVLFTGSGYLMDAIQQVEDEDFPFHTTIKKHGKSFQFT